jgi:succinate-acetate transporter protein
MAMSADASHDLGSTTSGAVVPPQAGPQDRATERTTEAPAAAAAAAEAPASGPLIGDPQALGLPCFIAGSVALGLALVGVVPISALSAAVPIILTATAIGLFLATIWAGSLGQTAVASVFGIFGGFWLSYAVLSLGLTHNWFGIVTPGAIRSTFELFLISWLVVMVMLTIATLRLPMAYTAVFVLVDVALLLLFLAFNAIPPSIDLLRAAGWVALGFALVGVYLYVHSVSVATGGRKLPLGRAAMR